MLEVEAAVRMIARKPLDLSGNQTAIWCHIMGKGSSPMRGYGSRVHGEADRHDQALF